MTRSRPSRARRFTASRVSLPGAGANRSATAAPTAAPARNARSTPPPPLLVCWFDMSCSPKETDFDLQELLRIGEDRGDQFPHLGHRSVHVLIQLTVLKQLSRGALALLQRRDHLVQPVGHRV